MKKLVLFLIPIFLFATNIILQYPNLKNYYYANQIVNIDIKVITPTEENLSLNTPEYIEYNITKINPFTHLVHLRFKNIPNREYKIILAGDTFYKPINIGNLFSTKYLEEINKFSNILADKFKIENPIASKYDNNYNMLSFTIKYNLANINDFYLNSEHIKEQKLTPINNTTASYYAIVDKKLKTLTFYYFNTQKDNYEKISIPINIKEEKISTQTDIKPEENIFLTPINILFITIILGSILVAIVYNSLILGIVPVILITMFIYLNMPKGEKTLQAQSKIYILPLSNSTIFYETKEPQKVKILKTYKDYSKIEFNNKIGWVKNENLY